MKSSCTSMERYVSLCVYGVVHINLSNQQLCGCCCFNLLVQFFKSGYDPKEQATPGADPFVSERGSTQWTATTSALTSLYRRCIGQRDRRPQVCACSTTTALCSRCAVMKQRLCFVLRVHSCAVPRDPCETDGSAGVLYAPYLVRPRIVHVRGGVGTSGPAAAAMGGRKLFCF